MKLRSLAKFALKQFKKGVYHFDCPERQKEAERQIKAVTCLRHSYKNLDLEDPIVEIHVGVAIPNFDYPLVPLDGEGNPKIWVEDNIFDVPGECTHTFRGIGLSGESYFLSHMENLLPFRDVVIKVDRYTDHHRAAYAFVCIMTQIIDKSMFKNETGNLPIKNDHQTLVDTWDKMVGDKTEYIVRNDQQKLYLKWMQKWIAHYGRNPETHLKRLKIPEKPSKKLSLDDINTIITD